MRNPNRIYEIMVILQKIWQSQPDTRFNQLINNLQWEYASENKAVKELWEKEEHEDIGVVAYRKHNTTDLYHVEDDEFLVFLRNKLDEL